MNKESVFVGGGVLGADAETDIDPWEAYNCEIRKEKKKTFMIVLLSHPQLKLCRPW